jgi:hypothetical protein
VRDGRLELLRGGVGQLRLGLGGDLDIDLGTAGAAGQDESEHADERRDSAASLGLCPHAHPPMIVH